MDPLRLVSPRTCHCSQAWEPLRLQFLEALQLHHDASTFGPALGGICSQLEGRVIEAVPRFLEVSFGSRAEIERLARTFAALGDCLPGLVAGTYACLVAAWLAYDSRSLRRLVSIITRLLVFADGCFEPGSTRWGITSGQVWRQVRDSVMGVHDVDWAPRQTPVCAAGDADSFVGHCGRRAPHEVRLAVAGPLEAIAADEVVLCTHTSGDALGLVAAMLESWRGPASVAVFRADAEELREWLLALGEQGSSKVVASVVGQNGLARTQHDWLYPANLLRQAAVDAAPGRMVLLADPGFVPSWGLHESLGPTEALGAAVRVVAQEAATAFLVASFVVPESTPKELALEELRSMVEMGEAVSFDARVCSLCRSFAWQWLLLSEPSSMQFQAVEPGDLHHPAWLLEKALLPRLPPFLHGLVGPASGEKKTGWTGLPCGLKASAEQLRAKGARLLLLPGGFLHRGETLPLPSHHWEDVDDWYPVVVAFDLMFRRATARLPLRNWTQPPAHGIQLPGRFMVEVLPARSLGADVFLLQQGRDASLLLVVMVSTVMASTALERLLTSVPWSVYGVALGAKNYWATALEKLPPFLKRLPPSSLVAMVDAYDVVLFPCSRSIAAEYAKFEKDLVWAADKPCFPNRAACRSCEEQYPPGHPDMEACRAYPNVNGGCYMGTAAALVHALEWMRWRGAAGGLDDQENKQHFRNSFPEKVALDHRQKLFSCLFGSPASTFFVENCSVLSRHTGEEVCFAHANGGTKFEILPGLLAELEEKGCLPKVTERRAQAYPGIHYPSMIWW